MRKLIIERTSNSPEVFFDPERNKFQISGESRPPNVAIFYDEIIRWIKDFTLYLSENKDKTAPIDFDLDFTYFNSSSAKYILDFCKQIAALSAKKKGVKIIWHFEKDDIDMLEVGKEMSRISKVPFDFKPKEHISD